MATDWFYRLGEEKHGPFSSNQLRDLVKAGTVTRTTLVRKNGMPDWKPAGEIEKLFIETPVASPSSGVSSLMDKAKAATKAAALATEKTKLSTVTLPAAYAALGKDCFQAKRWDTDFPEAYKELADLVRQLQESKRKATETVSGTGLADKAKSVASKGVEFAKSQQLSLQINTALARLGKSAYEKHGDEAGPSDLVGPIKPLLVRLGELNTEVGQQVSKAGGKKKLLWAGGVVLALMAFGAVLNQKEKSQSTQTTSDSATSDDTSAADEEAYQEGYRYAQGVLMQARSAPAWQKRQIMEQLDADHMRRTLGYKPRRFYAGVAAAMEDLVKTLSQ